MRTILITVAMFVLVSSCADAGPRRWLVRGRSAAECGPAGCSVEKSTTLVSEPIQAPKLEPVQAPKVQAHVQAEVYAGPRRFAQRGERRPVRRALGRLCGR